MFPQKVPVNQNKPYETIWCKALPKPSLYSVRLRQLELTMFRKYQPTSSSIGSRYMNSRLISTDQPTLKNAILMKSHRKDYWQIRFGDFSALLYSRRILRYCFKGLSVPSIAATTKIIVAAKVTII